MFKNLKGDIFGGITVSVVALPLAIAFGMASMNGRPEGAIAGLYGAIFTGIFSTLFGGTPALVNGPTGAMTVVLTHVYITAGPGGFFVAMAIAGIMQILLGLFKLGKYVKYIPRPVISGFTNGIGILIFLNQIPDFKSAPVIAAIIIFIMLAIPKITNIIPASLIGLICVTPIARKFFPNIPVVGEIPAGFPIFHIPDMNNLNLKVVLTGAVTLCVLASIESLLSSLVVSEMTETKSDNNRELLGQGIGNFIAPFFGGLMGTGAIVRSAVNVNNGGRSKLSGILHGIIILIVTVKFGWLASMIPKGALAGVLMITAVKMIEFESIKGIKKVPKADALVMISTMVVTVVTDLTTAVGVGIVLSMALFVYNIGKIPVERSAADSGLCVDRIMTYTVPGAMFFGSIDNILENIENCSSKIVILNMSHVGVIDETAATALIKYHSKISKDGKHLFITRLQKTTHDVLMNMYGKEITEKNILFNSIEQARDYALNLLDDMNVTYQEV